MCGRSTPCWCSTYNHYMLCVADSHPAGVPHTNTTCCVWQIHTQLVFRIQTLHVVCGRFTPCWCSAYKHYMLCVADSHPAGVPHTNTTCCVWQIHTLLVFRIQTLHVVCGRFTPCWCSAYKHYMVCVADSHPAGVPHTNTTCCVWQIHTLLVFRIQTLHVVCGRFTPCWCSAYNHYMLCLADSHPAGVPHTNTTCCVWQIHTQLVFRIQTLHVVCGRFTPCWCSAYKHYMLCAADSHPAGVPHTNTTCCVRQIHTLLVFRIQTLHVVCGRFTPSWCSAYKHYMLCVADSHPAGVPHTNTTCCVWQIHTLLVFRIQTLHVVCGRFTPCWCSAYKHYMLCVADSHPAGVPHTNTICAHTLTPFRKFSWFCDTSEMH